MQHRENVNFKNKNESANPSGHWPAQSWDTVTVTVSFAPPIYLCP